MEQTLAIEQTRRWIESIVIGLNLCPFARRVFQADLIRMVESAVADEETLLEELGNELQILASTSVAQIETTLLIHPHVLQDFLEYNDFLAIAERLPRAMGLEGVIQIASFHPAYQFEGTEANDVENFTNRSPYPMLHLLREESITNISMDERELANIPERNIQLLRRLGVEEMRRRLGEIKGELR